MTKTTTLIATCCLSLAAIPVIAFACDKDKTAGCSESQRTVLKVNSDKASCGTKTARQLVDAARVSEGCTAGKGVANVLTASAGECESACPKQKTVNFLMKSLKGGCGDSCASKGDVVAALRTMSTYEKGLVCETSLDKLAGVANVRTVGKSSTCNASKNQVVRAPLSDCSSKANANVVAVGAGCSSKGKNTQVANVTTVGKGSGCCASKAKVDNQVANVTTTSGQCNASAKYVAYGCDKSDRVARAAAKAYIAMMSELKDMNGVESCSLEAAQKVLATVMADMKADSTTEVAALNVRTTNSGTSCSSAK